MIDRLNEWTICYHFFSIYLYCSYIVVFKVIKCLCKHSFSIIIIPLIYYRNETDVGSECNHIIALLPPSKRGFSFLLNVGLVEPSMNLNR